MFRDKIIKRIEKLQKEVEYLESETKGSEPNMAWIYHNDVLITDMKAEIYTLKKVIEK